MQVVGHFSGVLLRLNRGKTKSYDFSNFIRIFFSSTLELKIQLPIEISRSRGFRYFCNCTENCWKNKTPICDINKLTRNNCKYCRYEKCMDLAGMNTQYVISAYIPKVKRGPNKRVETSETKVVPFEAVASDNDLLKNIISVHRLHMNPNSIFLEVL